MLDWSDVRATAGACRKEAGANAAPDAALSAALSSRGLMDATITPADGFADNVLGAMERSGRTIYTSPKLSREERLFVKAHELGHYVLHVDPRLETRILPPVGEVGLHEGYSRRSFVEAQADVFASEFLCPTNALRIELASPGTTPRSVALRWGLSADLVTRQAARALIAVGGDGSAAAPRREPDPAQAAAAAWAGGHVLVEGSPGSGRTTTCVARIIHLLDQGTAAAALAAFCHDDAAARRLRAAVLAERPGAVQAWFGTVRRFALELVAACPSRIGRTPSFAILDETGSLAAMEAVLAARPAVDRGGPSTAVEMLRAIGRCKKAMLHPSSLRRSAAAEGDAIAEAWTAYDRLLADVDALDTNDLVRSAARALGARDVGGLVRNRFDHLVIDDFEEFHGADHALVRSMAAAGITVFATGHASASIQRHGGAAPLELARFEEAYAGARRMRLPRRRSRAPAIEEAIDRFAEGTPATSAAGRRRSVLAVSVADTIGGEAAAIAVRIERLRNGGVPYRDQAILARSHDTLDAFALMLEALGVPVAHMGELGDRREVRDLLAILGLIDGDAAALERAVGLSIYGGGAAAAAAVAGHARDRGMSIAQALAVVDEVAGLDSEGRRALHRLARDVEGLTDATDHWTALTTWLFERSGYLAAVSAEGDRGRTKLEAIGLLLGLCDEGVRHGDRTLSSLNARIARLRSIDQESHYRATRSDDDGTDRVRMMTIHAAKGRSFAAVHIPKVAAGRMPVDRPPRRDAFSGHPSFAISRAERLEEERAVFAVALTRARSHLHLTRALRYGSRAAGRSRFLDELGSAAADRVVAARDDGIGFSRVRGGATSFRPDP